MATQQSDESNDQFKGLSPEEIAAINGDDNDDENLDEIIGDDADDDTQEADSHDGDETIDAAETDEVKEDVEQSSKDDDVQFQPQITLQPVENFNEKIKSFKEEKEKLRNKLSDAEIDLDEYERLKDELTEQETDLKLQQRDYENEVKRKTSEGTQKWEWEQEQFFGRDANKIYGTNKLMSAALDAAVKQLANDPVNANRTGSWFLEQADEQVRQLLGGSKKDNTKKEEQKRKADLSILPKTLADIPAAENTETGGGEFDYLDKLDGVDLERELSKIARDPAKEARYLRS